MVSSASKDWTIAQLRFFLGRITYGFTNPMPTTHEGPLMLTAKDIEDGKIRYSSARHTSKKAFNRLTEKSKPKINDVLLTKDGSLGRVAVVDRSNICINQSIALLRPNKKIEPFFLKYLLQAPNYQHKMEMDASGTTIKHIYITKVDKMEVAVPPVETQKKIVMILKSYDDLIEINTRKMQILEDIAKTIFDEWFIHLRYPGYENTKVTEMPTRPIPMGWQKCKLGELITIDRGLSYKGKFLNKSGVPMINLGSIRPFAGLKLSGMKYYNGEIKERHKVRPGELLVANTDITQNREILGSPVIAPSFLGDNIIFSHHIYALRNKSEYSNYFFYYLLQTDEYRGRAMGFSTGTTVLALPKDAISEFEFLLPPIHIADEFAKFANNIHNLIEILVQKNDLLRCLQDLLLQKLISGEIDVCNLDFEGSSG